MLYQKAYVNIGSPKMFIQKEELFDIAVLIKDVFMYEQIVLQRVLNDISELNV